MKMNIVLKKNINMYKFIIILLLSATSLVAEAQLRYGFRFGGEFAKADLKNGIGAGLDNRSGFSGGLALEYQFEKCGFAPDIALLYTRYNTRLAMPGSTPRSFGRNFIEVPVHLKWKFWIPQTKNLFAPMIYTGPSLLFRLDHNDGIAYPDYSDLPPEVITSRSIKHFKTDLFQPGWDVGIGFDIINFIQVEAGYRFGLGNALDNSSDMRLRTNGWNLAATILFDF